MTSLNPTINTNFYGFDYYEVAYTALATQIPTLGNFKFPNLTFASGSAYLQALATVPVNNAPCVEKVGQTFSQNVVNKDVITINDNRAYNVIPNNIGVEFYTQSWKDALDVCKEINTFHTWKVDVGGNYPNDSQRSKVRRLLWNKWWKNILYAKIDISDFFQLGLQHSLDEQFATTENIDDFKAWLDTEKVCDDTKALLIDMYNNLPSEVLSEFNDIEEILGTPLVPVGVYHIIEKITAKGTDADCYSPYACLNSATPSDITNLSDGKEEEECVTYWLSATPETSALSEGYTPLSGPCDGSVNISATDAWTKYKTITVRRPRFDFIKVNGRLIVPDLSIVTRNGISIVKAQDIFDACNTTYNLKINYTPFSQSFDAPYGECCVISGGLDKNWTMTSTIDNPYGIQATPKDITDAEGDITLIIPQRFFSDMKSNPALLNSEFVVDWNIKLKVSGECLVQKIIDTHIASFYPFCDSKKIYYQPGCGIIFNNAEGFTNGDTANALTSLNEMHELIRSLFNSTYNCYAREVSKTQIYGDILKIVGRFYDEHGSECWFVLKQVLRPTIAQDNIVTTEQLQGFNMPSSSTTQPTVPTVATNQILPEPLPIPSVNLSNMFKKGNKICTTLPTPLNYK